MIIWAGKSNEDVGMVIEHYPKVIIPKRKIEVQSVPGRSGDIVIDQDSFENYEQQYSAFLDAKELGGLPAVMPRIADWLLGSPGYQKLEDSYFPDVFRYAYCSNTFEFTNTFGEYGRGTLTFNCDPHKYFKMGEKELTLAKNQKLFNPSSFKALPLFTVLGSGAGVLTVNGNNISISEIGESVNLDAQTYLAYNGSTNRSSTITGKYEDLALGKETVITWSGGVTGVKIIPRWWTI